MPAETISFLLFALFPLACEGWLAKAQFWLAQASFIALILASINIFGGFLVTERMLAMYKKKG